MPRVLHHLPRRLALVGILLAAATLVFGGKEDFATIAKQVLAETHAKNFREGNIKGCVSMYAGNARFFVDNQLVASGAEGLLEFYRGLRDVDRIGKIEIDAFVDVGSTENLGWAVFDYTKEYDLKDRNPAFLRSNKLEGFSTLNVKQHGVAIFARIDGHWKVRTMAVYDPEIWEPRK